MQPCTTEQTWLNEIKCYWLPETLFLMLWVKKKKAIIVGQIFSIYFMVWLPLSPCCSLYWLWGLGCDITIVYMLSIGISAAKQTEAMYGAECNNHSSRKTPCLTERKSEAAERIWTWQILVITQSDVWPQPPLSEKHHWLAKLFQRT